VTSQSADSNLANNTASAQTLVTDLANVAVNKIASSSSVVAGQVITYQISVANAGPSTAKDVVIHDVITGLEWLTLQSATASCAADLAGVTCALGDVAPASARLIVLSFAVRADTPAGTVISDVAQIQSASALSVSGTPTAQRLYQMAQVLPAAGVQALVKPGVDRNFHPVMIMPERGNARRKTRGAHNLAFADKIPPCPTLSPHPMNMVCAASR
jgi:uncharacterized repeat protein (TIGR01451 family)